MRRIVVENYEEHKEEIDEYCRIHLCGYEIHEDGSAVIIVD